MKRFLIVILISFVLVGCTSSKGMVLDPLNIYLEEELDSLKERLFGPDYDKVAELNILFNVDLPAIQKKIEADFSGEVNSFARMELNDFIPLRTGYLLVTNPIEIVYQGEDKKEETTQTIYVIQIDQDGELVDYDVYDNYYSEYSYPPKTYLGSKIYITGTSSEKAWTLIYDYDGSFVREETQRLLEENGQVYQLDSFIKMNSDGYAIVDRKPMQWDSAIDERFQSSLVKFNNNDQRQWLKPIEITDETNDLFFVQGLQEDNQGNILVYGERLTGSEVDGKTIYTGENDTILLVGIYDQDGNVVNKIEYSKQNLQIDKSYYDWITSYDHTEKVYLSMVKSGYQLIELDGHSGKYKTTSIPQQSGEILDEVIYQDKLYILFTHKIVDYTISTNTFEEYSSESGTYHYSGINYFFQNDQIYFLRYSSTGVEVVEINRMK